MKEQFYNYGQSLGISTNDMQRLMSLAKDVIKNEHELQLAPTDWAKLRENFFKECTEEYETQRCVVGTRISLAPHDLFQWFLKNIDK